jgi:hypothetical protein
VCALYAVEVIYFNDEPELASGFAYYVLIVPTSKLKAIIRSVNIR